MFGRRLLKRQAVRPGSFAIVAIALLATFAVAPRVGSAAAPVQDPTHVRFFEPGHTGEGDFAYAPSSMTVGRRQYHFYCGNQHANTVVDSIYMAKFKPDGKGWVQASDQLVLRRDPGRWDSSHVCDPSVVRGNFRHRGTAYRYALFYTGTRDPAGTGQQNSLGLAYSNDLTSWVKINGPLVSRRSHELWGVGQPSAVTAADGSVYLFYTRSNPTRTVWRTFTTTGAGIPVLGPENRITVAGTQPIFSGEWAIFNADFAYDPVRDRFWMVKPAGYDAAEPRFVSNEVELAWISGDSLRNGGGMWHSEGTIGASVTGEPKNHNAGLQRTPKGYLVERDRVRVNLTTSPIAPFPLSLFGYNLSSVTVPVGDTADPFDAQPGKMKAIDPYRAIDTREGFGGRLRPRRVRRYRLADTPTNATAVVLNVAAVQSAQGGHLTVWDCTTGRPATANLNFVGRDTRANQVTVSVEPNTKDVCFYTTQAIDLVVDVFGWFGPPSRSFDLGFVPVRLHRVYDSRRRSKFTARETRRIRLADRVPADATAVTLTLTTTDSDVASYATVWPCDQRRPTLSALNAMSPRPARGNQVTVRLDARRGFCIYSSAAQHLVVDLVGVWIPDQGDGGQTVGLVSQRPAIRWLDTRRTRDPLRGDETRRVLPAQDQSVVGQLAATGTFSPGFFALFPCDEGYRGTSTVNFGGPGSTASVAFVMRADRGGICVRSSGGGDVVLDIGGYLGLGTADANSISDGTPPPPTPELSGCGPCASEDTWRLS